MTMTTEKSAALSRFISIAKQSTANDVTRKKLDTVLSALVDLASHEQWWSSAYYPDPAEGDLQARYLVHQEPDSTYALYLNVMKQGKRITPHNHTTWACIAAVQGVESNYLYDRTDDGSRPGVATLSKVGEHPVAPGGGIALLADDIHAVKIEGPGVIRHLHMYGLALEKLTTRIAFDTENNTYKLMSVGVKTRPSPVAS